MSSFSLVISPPDALQPGFIESSVRSSLYALPLRYLSAAGFHKAKTHGTMSHYALLPCTMCILNFGSWLEPRYIFAAGQLI